MRRHSDRPGTKNPGHFPWMLEVALIALVKVLNCLDRREREVEPRPQMRKLVHRRVRIPSLPGHVLAPPLWQTWDTSTPVASRPSLCERNGEHSGPAAESPRCLADGATLPEQRDVSRGGAEGLFFRRVFPWNCSWLCYRSGHTPIPLKLRGVGVAGMEQLTR